MHFLRTIGSDYIWSHLRIVSAFCTLFDFIEYKFFVQYALSVNRMKAPQINESLMLDQIKKEVFGPDHVQTIKSLLLTMQASDKIHALIIEGPAGWGKTTAVSEALKLASTSLAYLGAYSTALNLFNFLCANKNKVVIIDDCSGLFNDANSMAILKAATWGTNYHRTVKWGSTSSKALTDEFIFAGKLIIICNSFPTTSDADAVRSRSFPYKIEVSVHRAKELLQQAAQNTKWFSNLTVATEVANFLCVRLLETNVQQMSYRTLQMGYELALHNPNHWQELLSSMIVAAPEEPRKLVLRLAQSSMKVKDQALQFETATGLKRRTFFKYRKELRVGK